MTQQMNLVGLLLKPSILSLVAAIILASAMLFIPNYLYITSSQFHEFFFGTNGLALMLREGLNGLGELSVALSSQPYTYHVILILAATVVGLITYVVLQSLTRASAAALGDYIAAHDAAQHKQTAAVREIGAQWGLRGAALAVWIVYWLFFASILLPFCILLSRVGLGEISSLSGWLYSLMAYFLLVGALHLHVIFARLIVLRPRLFGGHDAILAAMYQGNNKY